jgi:hypothetical protein
MIVFLLALFCLGGSFVAGQDDCYPDATIVKRLMDGYEEEKIPPSLNVSAQIWLADVVKMDALEGEVTMSLYLSSRWIDPKLNYESWFRAKIKPCHDNVTADVNIPIWTPSLTFVNDRNTEVSKSPLDNIFYAILPNGTVWTVHRLIVKAPCTLDLSGFPYDTAECVLHLESYRYRLEEMDFHWVDKNPILPLKSFAAAPGGYNFTHASTQRIEVTYPAGRWVELRGVFHFKRHGEGPILTLILPSSIVLLVSFLAFLLPPPSLTVRTLLHLQAILGLLALVWYYGNLFPLTGPCNRAQIWLGVCILFALCGLIETIVAYHWGRVCARRKGRKYQYVPNQEEDQNHLFQKTSDYTVDDEESAAGGGRCWRICSNIVDYIAILVFPGLFAAFAALYSLGIF